MEHKQHHSQIYSHDQHNNYSHNEHQSNNKPKQKDHFKSALVVVALAIFISLIGLMSGQNNLTGFATSTSYNSDAATQTDVKEYNDVKSLEVLAPGNYYIDANGFIYWMDDDSTPAVAKVKSLTDDQKNRKIYIDDNGNVGYILN
ncbi:MAG TPA: hypothetical protein VJJ52_06610 [Candidatus Nanoarchaeia archaeon]|nr:hypothetical protein [Candidatus Nanoarchaeia archaeon]